MRVVVLNQYYPPDVAPTGVMLAGVVSRMVAEGHEVTVLCAGGGYGGQVGVDGVEAAGRLVRVGATRFGRGTVVGKLMDYLSYYVGVMWKLWVMRPGPERVVALTTPPYLSVVARVVSKLRGGDHAHWVMDLYPDVMVAHGMLRGGGLGERWLGWLAGWGMGGKRSVGVMTLGPDMAERVGRRVAGVEVAWVPLWAGQGDGQGDGVGDEARALREERGWGEDELVVMYSGNMGLGHRFGEVLEAARRMVGEPVRFVFFGGGKRRGEIERFVEAGEVGKVELHAYAPAGVLAAHLASADVHLASLEEGWTGTMVPSKLQGVFAAGRPVVFVGDADSSLGRWVEESGGGWVVAPGDVEALVRVLGEARDLAERVRRGRLALAYAKERFDARVNAGVVAGWMVGRPRVFN